MFFKKRETHFKFNDKQAVSKKIHTYIYFYCIYGNYSFNIDTEAQEYRLPPDVRINTANNKH